MRNVMRALLGRAHGVGVDRGGYLSRRGWRNGWVKRALGGALVLTLLLGGLLGLGPGAAEAIPRGEAVTFPGGLTISNFVLPNGKRAYCIEIAMGEPSGYVSEAGRVSLLPGRTGLFPAWGETEGMRQMNYLIDTHGQSRDAWTAAAVQLTIWRMRENFTPTNAGLNRKIAVLNGSQMGRDLIAKSDDLYAEAKRLARPPAAPRPVSADGFKIEVDPSGISGRFRISYPKGTTSLSVTGAKFVRNGMSTLEVPEGEASVRYVAIDKGAAAIALSGSWAASGTAGWGPQLDIYNSSTASGGVGQRVAVATGKSDRPRLTGKFPARNIADPQPPTASSLAQPSAEVGGTMTDTLIVSEVTPGNTKMWPNAVADFTAFLEPEEGAVKYTDAWEPVLGEPYEAQAEDPNTGQPLWREWWADFAGEALRDEKGNKIPTVDDAGNQTSGVAAGGVSYPVVMTAGDGSWQRDADGNLRYSVSREPVIEERRDPVRWTKAELSGMSAAARCTAQPVAKQSGIAVPAPGQYTTKPIQVRSAGTIRWVERITSPKGTLHVGKCGIANETTRVGKPGVVTEALPSAAVGEELYDTATVSGNLVPGLKYSLRFEAYSLGDPKDREESGGGSPAPDTPVCDAKTRIFRSQPVPVDRAGKYQSPGFTAKWEHGTQVWWVETLSVETRSGTEVLQRGECGLINETTSITRPEVRTQALEQAAIGDLLTDTATITGALAVNEGTRWELGFDAYRAAQPSGTQPSATQPSGKQPSGKQGTDMPVCEASNLLFSVAPVAVTGLGDYASAPVVARSEWVGTIWWVETLWLVQDGVRTPVLKGECGLPNESTRVAEPEVVTQAKEFAVLGDRMSDVATVTGPLANREGVSYELVFQGYRGEASLTGTDRAVCDQKNLLFETEPVGVSVPLGTSESVEVRSPEVTALPGFGETVWWVETLRMRSADGVQELLRGTCGLPDETTTVQFPEVRTEAAGTIAPGGEMFDTAFVGGVFSERPDIEYRLTFQAYARVEGKAMTCSPETELPRFSDEVGVPVTGPGRYVSKRVSTTAADVGLGGYVETLVMVEGGKQHVVWVGKCGEAGENFEITRTLTLGLPKTGVGVQPWPLFVGGGVLLVGSGVAFGLRLRRRRAADSVMIRDCRDAL